MHLFFGFYVCVSNISNCQCLNDLRVRINDVGTPFYIFIIFV